MTSSFTNGREGHWPPCPLVTPMQLQAENQDHVPGGSGEGPCYIACGMISTRL